MKLSEWILDCFFTPRCVFCERLLRAGQRPRICPFCKGHFQKHYLSDRQQVDDEDKINGHALFLYEGMVRATLHRFKYEGQKSYAQELALWMYQKDMHWILGLKPDALIPVPLHKKRLRKRGYNQARALAEELGCLTGLPVLEAVERVINTKPQMALTRTLRVFNMKGSMQATKTYQEYLKQHPGPHTFVIVDDIYTTGSTIETICEALQAEDVTFYFWAAARSHPDEELDVEETIEKGGDYDGRA